MLKSIKGSLAENLIEKVGRERERDTNPYLEGVSLLKGETPYFTTKKKKPIIDDFF